MTDPKRALRDTAKAARRRAFEAHGRGASEALARHGLGFLKLRDAPRIVSGFIAIRDEIDPLPLLTNLHSQGASLALPVMLGKRQPLEMRLWQPGDALAETTWAIQEPLPSSPAVDPDIVLVPLLAFDLSGYRLGYGGGFYDRTLARLRALKPVIAIGLAYGEQRVDAVPHAEYDQRVDWVLTPSGPIKTQRPSFPAPMTG